MNPSIRIALGITVVLSVYMLTRLLGCGRDSSVEDDGPGIAAEEVRMTVKVKDLVAREIPRKIVMTGKTMPSRSVDLKAETPGRVVRVGDRRGTAVEAGMIIAEIEINDRMERLAQAQATVEQARLEYEASLRLQEKDLQSASGVAQLLSSLRGAEQRLRAVELDIANTRFMIPFDGVLQDRFIEEGDYLKVGDPVARIIDLDPLVIEAEATEIQVPHLKIGETGTARLPGEREVSGRIRYVAGESDPQSRTFTVELEVDNPDLDILAGVTARLEVETERVMAYRISPALVSILDDGRFGVKILNGEDRVEFVEADIVESEPDALWLGSLPEKIRLITIGQDFVKLGEQVNFVLDGESGQ
jgi:multidrug efflux system membrane fusion protein